MELNVSVCGAAQENAAILLHWLASGDVLGHTQNLRLILHDSADNALDLEEQAVNLYEACYPLLTGVRAETGELDSLGSCDVALLLLEQADLDDRLIVLAGYAAALINTPRRRQKAVILAGQQATVAACIMCALTPQLSHHLVIAVDLPVTTFHYSQHAGSYQLASRVSKTVHSWWSELKERNTTNLGVKSDSFPSLVPLPVMLTALQMKQNNTLPVDWSIVKQRAEDFNTALQHLGLSEADLVTSFVACKL